MLKFGCAWDGQRLGALHDKMTIAESSSPHTLKPGTEYFHVPDLKQAHRLGCELFDPHDLKVRAEQDRFCFTCRHSRLGDSMSISRMQFAAEVDINTRRTEDFILLHMPLAGRNEVSNGGQNVLGTPMLFTVSNTSQSLTQRRSADCEMVTLRVSMESARHYIENTLGMSMKQKPVFQMEMPSTSRAGMALTHLVHLFLATAQDIKSPRADLLAMPTEQMLLAILLTSQPNNYEQALQAQSATPAPHYIRRAVEYIQAHADSALTINDIARHAGVCSRSLFIGFRKYRETTPMDFVKSVRLERVREQLLSSKSDYVLITDVASRWGFFHHGNFAAAYKRKFGELPSDTLRFRNGGGL